MVLAAIVVFNFKKLATSSNILTLIKLQRSNTWKIRHFTRQRILWRHGTRHLKKYRTKLF